jgi:hypothetical protein
MKEMEPERPEQMKSDETGIPESLRELAPGRSDSDDNEQKNMLVASSQRELDKHTWHTKHGSSQNDGQDEKSLKQVEPERPEHTKSDETGIPESLRKLAPERNDLKPQSSDQDNSSECNESDSDASADQSYPENWDSLRRQVYNRDDYQCQNCGSKGGPRGNTELHAHHVVPRSSGGNDAMSNLVTLCSNCHERIHDHMN